MSADHDRKNRSHDEVTADLLIQRLDSDQLVLLVGQPEYRKFQDKIVERLQPVNGFGLDNFRKVHHPSRGCKVTEKMTGEDISVRGDTEFGSWEHKLPLKELECNRHGVTSVEFYDYAGGRHEGPFARSYSHSY